MDYDKLIAELEQIELGQYIYLEDAVTINQAAAAIRELKDSNATHVMNMARMITDVDQLTSDRDDLRAKLAPLGDAQTTTEQLSEQIEELKADSIRIRKAIEQHREQMKRHGHHVPSPIDAMLYAALKSDKAAK